MAKKVLVVEDDSNIAELLRLYLEKDGGRVFHSTPDCTAIPESARNALETFSADLLDQSPYSLLSACPVCFGTQGTEENGGNK